MSKEKKLTYEQLISECIDDVDRLYARLGGLRDCGEGQEKEFCNYGRGALGELRSKLSAYRDLIYTNGRHNMIIGNWSGDAKLKLPDYD